MTHGRLPPRSLGGLLCLVVVLVAVATAGPGLSSAFSPTAVHENTTTCDQAEAAVTKALKDLAAAENAAGQAILRTGQRDEDLQDAVRHANKVMMATRRVRDEVCAASNWVGCENDEKRLESLFHTLMREVDALPPEPPRGGPTPTPSYVKRNLVKLAKLIGRSRTCEAHVLGKVKTIKPINHLQVGLTCGNVLSAPITIHNPPDAKPVIYVATFGPHPFCGVNSQYLVNADTGKRLPGSVIAFQPDTEAVADQYPCAQDLDLPGCKGQGPDSQLFVFGITVTNHKPPH